MEWFDPNKRKPKEFVSVLGCMSDSGPFPPVRECYRTDDDLYYFPGLREHHPIRLWADMPLPEDEPSQQERIELWMMTLDDDKE